MKEKVGNGVLVLQKELNKDIILKSDIFPTLQIFFERDEPRTKNKITMSRSTTIHVPDLGGRIWITLHVQSRTISLLFCYFLLCFPHGLSISMKKSEGSQSNEDDDDQRE